MREVLGALPVVVTQTIRHLSHIVQTAAAVVEPEVADEVVGVHLHQFAHPLPDLIGCAGDAPDPEFIEIAQEPRTADPGPSGPEGSGFGSAHGLFKDLEIAHMDAILNQSQCVLTRIEQAGHMDPPIQRQRLAITPVDPTLAGLCRHIGDAAFKTDLVV